MPTNVDPFMDKEQKKRLREARTLLRELDNPTDQAFRRIVSPQAELEAWQARGIGGAIADTGRAIGEGIRGTGQMLRGAASYAFGGSEGFDQWADEENTIRPPASLPADAAARLDAARRAAEGGADAASANEIRRNPGQYGLTRIVKNPDGSYTNMTSSVQPGAETRYYNQFGNEEGVDYRVGKDGNPQRFKTKYDTALSDQNMLIAGGEGRKSQKWVERVQGETLARKEKELMDSLPPEQRVSLMNAQMRESGQDRRVGATLLRTDARLALDRDKVEGENAAKAIAADLNLQDREKENPALALGNLVGSMGNMPRAEKLARLADPNSAEGARAQRIMTLIAGKNDPNFDLKTIEPASGFRKLFGNRLVGGTDFFKDNIDVAGSGLSDEDAMLLADAMRSIAARTR